MKKQSNRRFKNEETPHNPGSYVGFGVPYYTIPSDNRELQLRGICPLQANYYIIPSDNRQLQRQPQKHISTFHKKQGVESKSIPEEIGTRCAFLCDYVRVLLPVM